MNKPREKRNKFSLIRVRGAHIVRSLLSEGYQLVSQSNACQKVYLRHKTNGNVICVYCGRMGVYVVKNGNLVKLELV